MPWADAAEDEREAGDAHPVGPDRWKRPEHKDHGHEQELGKDPASAPARARRVSAAGNTHRAEWIPGPQAAPFRGLRAAGIRFRGFRPLPNKRRVLRAEHPLPRMLSLRQLEQRDELRIVEALPANPVDDLP